MKHYDIDHNYKNHDIEEVIKKIVNPKSSSSETFKMNYKECFKRLGYWLFYLSEQESNLKVISSQIFLMEVYQS